MARLKASVAQIRTACANDVRKRDVQIQRLKGHLTTQQRGNRAGLVGASITITPGVTGMGAGSGREEEAEKGSVGTEDPAYSLRQETTEFLTQLGQSLSDENDALIGLVRGAVVTLKELQGIPEAGTREQAVESTAGADGINGGGEMLCALPTSYDALAADLDGVLENLKLLLTNPNFVPLDEVAVREEEIARLRHGWEKMEARWKEAVAMMQSWQERMRSGGDTVTLHDLNLGLGLDEEPKSASAVQGEVEEVSASKTLSLLIITTMSSSAAYTGRMLMAARSRGTNCPTQPMPKKQTWTVKRWRRQTMTRCPSTKMPLRSTSNCKQTRHCRRMTNERTRTIMMMICSTSTYLQNPNRFKRAAAIPDPHAKSHSRHRTQTRPSNTPTRTPHHMTYHPQA